MRNAAAPLLAPCLAVACVLLGTSPAVATASEWSGYDPQAPNVCPGIGPANCQAAPATSLTCPAIDAGITIDCVTGSEAPLCDGVVLAPTGFYGTSDGVLIAEVEGEVVCNFDPPVSVSATMYFAGRTGSRSVFQSGPNVTCADPSNTPCHVSAPYSYTPAPGESGAYDHNGELRFYWTDPSGGIHSEDVFGPHNTGEYFAE